VDPSLMTVYPDFVQRMNDLLPPDVVVGLWIFPVQIEGGSIHVCLLNPGDTAVLGALERVSGCRILPLASHEGAIGTALQQHYASHVDGPVQFKGAESLAAAEGAYRRALEAPIEEREQDAAALVSRMREVVERDPERFDDMLREPALVRLVHQLLVRSIEMGASDVHVEPMATGLRVRVRVDGAMQVAWSLPPVLAAPVVGRLKLLADLPTRGDAGTLDSAISQGLVWGRAVDLRVSVVRAITGDTVVLRIIERERTTLTLRDLGADAATDALLKRASELPNGLILVTGPTGSGKTSTLYALIQALNRADMCIITAEDPVETRVGGVVQVQCGEQTSLGFAEALRSFLRQDPDVMMVGEIRDLETAEIALKAAMTGHLVLSTLHTNDAVGAVLRLINMGLEPFLVASSLRLVLAQRLVRRLCRRCRTPGTEVHQVPVGGTSVAVTPWVAAGCEACGRTGYRGRLGIFETLWVSEDVEDLIANRASARDLRVAGARAGLITLRESARRAVEAGETSIDEMLEHTMDPADAPVAEVSRA
jgi:type IV pilus assembly protein PilB